ncbi:MAG: hypothetical protein VZQ98_14435 [Bacteroidales bacterium]|nr:hypothetical protein [Bacteroidales bacterium]
MNMNEFELFTLIYYSLDAYFGKDVEDASINCVLSDMCPFTFDDIGSADPVMYEDYIKFIDGREITIENSLDFAREYVKTIDFADVTSALEEMTEEKWIKGCKEFLSQPHKGAELTL